MDGAVVGAESNVGATAFVKAGKVIPPRSLVLGAPARIVRAVSDEDIAWKSAGTRQYHALNLRSMRTLREVDALTEAEADRPRIVIDEPYRPR
jgi:phenylacetic acid degradation protein